MLQEKDFVDVFIVLYCLLIRIKRAEVSVTVSSLFRSTRMYQQQRGSLFNQCFTFDNNDDAEPVEIANRGKFRTFI